MLALFWGSAFAIPFRTHRSRGSFAPSSCTAARWPSPWLYLGCVDMEVMSGGRWVGGFLCPSSSIFFIRMYPYHATWWWQWWRCYDTSYLSVHTHTIHTIYAYSTPIPRLPPLVHTVTAEFLRWTGLHFPSCPTGFPWPSCITGGKGEGQAGRAIGHGPSSGMVTPLLHTVCNRIFTPANSARWSLSMDGSSLFLQRLKFPETSSSSVPGLWRWYIK